jgi:hypothetical protein
MTADAVAMEARKAADTDLNALPNRSLSWASYVGINGQ